MGSTSAPFTMMLLCILFGFSALSQSSALGLDINQTAVLFVNASSATARKIPDHLFGIFFEEINHAGAGGLWAELVSNRGFEAGGQHSPSNIAPWSEFGDESYLRVSTDFSSCFDSNRVALRMEVLCDIEDVSHICPPGGVGISNPGYWGMNVEQGKTYNLILYVRSHEPIDLLVFLSDSSGMQILASAKIIDSDVSNWTKKEVLFKAEGTNPNAVLQLRTSRRGVIWFDQVSLMPSDTYKGHGFRNDLFKVLADLKPGFIRFPGGCFVEGHQLSNAVRWKETVGPWENRPGHYGDVWKYWTDDALGHFEFLQLAEDLGALPIWVFNSGNTDTNYAYQVDPASILPFVQEALDGIEFARGDPSSVWGHVRAEMGHPEPFDLRYVAVGNEDCGQPHYRENYLKFYAAIRRAYPDIKIISNCDGSSHQLDHPADLFDYHTYPTASEMFSLAHYFDHTSRNGPKAFVSEYAVRGKDAGKGSFLAALAEAAFLIGLEENSDIVEMASYAPLFVNVHDWRWTPDAIVFDSSQLYGTPSYWMQHFFKDSNGATLLSTTLQTNLPSSLIASAITFQNSSNSKSYLRVKVVNFGSNTVNLRISIEGQELDSEELFGATRTTLYSDNVMDENSFQKPKKVAPVQTVLDKPGQNMDVVLLPHSLSCFDLLIKSNTSSIAGAVAPFI